MSFTSGYGSLDAGLFVSGDAYGVVEAVAPSTFEDYRRFEKEELGGIPAPTLAPILAVASRYRGDVAIQNPFVMSHAFITPLLEGVPDGGVDDPIYRLASARVVEDYLRHPLLL